MSASTPTSQFCSTVKTPTSTKRVDQSSNARLALLAKPPSLKKNLQLAPLPPQVNSRSTAGFNKTCTSLFEPFGHSNAPSSWFAHTKAHDSDALACFASLLGQNEKLATTANSGSDASANIRAREVEHARLCSELAFPDEKLRALAHAANACTRDTSALSTPRKAKGRFFHWSLLPFTPEVMANGRKECRAKNAQFQGINFEEGTDSRFLRPLGFAVKRSASECSCDEEGEVEGTSSSAEKKQRRSKESSMCAKRESPCSVMLVEGESLLKAKPEVSSSFSQAAASIAKFVEQNQLAKEKPANSSDLVDHPVAPLIINQVTLSDVSDSILGRRNNRAACLPMRRSNTSFGTTRGKRQH